MQILIMKFFASILLLTVSLALTTLTAR
jgi:hypothetical protein